MKQGKFQGVYFYRPDWWPVDQFVYPSASGQDLACMTPVIHLSDTPSPVRSHPFTVRFPNPVYRVALLRSKYLGYQNVSEYLINLVRCDGVLQRDHDLTVWISQLSLATQDFIDDRLENFPPAIPGTQPSLTHYFCAGLIAVETRHGQGGGQAIAAMPAPLARLCTENGFA